MREVRAGHVLLFLAWNVFSAIVYPIKDMCVLPAHRNTARITVALSLALLPGCLVQLTAPVAKENFDDIELFSTNAAGGSQFLHDSLPSNWSLSFG
jgi:hypothetical protein